MASNSLRYAGKLRPGMSQHLSQPEDYSKLLNDYDTWLFDCDGVLWQGSTLIAGSKEVLDYLRKAGKKIVFVTNNATQSRKSYKKKFDKLGIQAHTDEIFGSAYASAVYVSQILKLPEQKKKVYVIGERGLEEELDEEGVEHLGGTDPTDCTPGPLQMPFTPDPDVAAVLVGLDTSITYTKLSKAFIYLSQGNVKFLATNIDPTFPAGENLLLPGAGTMSAPLKHALQESGKGQEPTSLGKPGKGMMDCILAKHKLDPRRTIMVGDRLDTDIAFGQLSEGMGTLLVMTGVTKPSDLPTAKIVPMCVTNQLGDLLAGAKS